MTTFIVLMIIIILFGGVALIFSTLEKASGNIGDCSMVPSIMMIMLLFMVIAAVFGFVFGDVNIHFNSIP